MNTALFALALTSATTTTEPTQAQRIRHDFRCYLRRQVEVELGDTLTARERRALRDLINRAVR